MKKPRILLWSWAALTAFLLLASNPTNAAKKSLPALDFLEDAKDLKKLLRTKNNVLVTYFFRRPAQSAETVHLLRQVSQEVRGQGTLVGVDCSAQATAGAKKICKKWKVTENEAYDKEHAYIMKHYKDGEFHVDYQRQRRLQSMVTFLRAPTEDLPWDEDVEAEHVTHIMQQAQFNKLMKKEKGKVMVMFYAPWCGFCKRMKPDYQQAAADLKGEAVLVAVDSTRPDNRPLSAKYNITGFPTLLYFHNGVMQYPYPGDNNKKAIAEFMRDPSPKAEAKQEDKEAEWKNDETSKVKHLTDATFDEAIAKGDTLVMFYAPWCGHCKKMKPEFNVAADQLGKDEESERRLAAVDCTSENALAKRFGIKGYPTVKFFRDGEFQYDAGHAREQKDIVAFIRDPKEPPPPPPPEKPWSEVEEAAEVMHLSELDFKARLKKKKHVLVMFYAPWCGHCKRAKPEIQSAAAVLRDNPKVEFAGVDCTVDANLCKKYDVKGYPTFKLFKYFDKEKPRSYDGGRTKDDFVRFMEDPDKPEEKAKDTPKSPEEQWAEHKGAEMVVHLTADNFQSFLKTKKSALVMFYAPWCGHCQAMKADYAGAAFELASERDTTVLAAVDATIHPDLANQFEVRGYPTLKHFAKGRLVEKYDGGRRKMDLVQYLKKKAAPAREEL